MATTYSKHNMNCIQIVTNDTKVRMQAVHRERRDCRQHIKKWNMSYSHNAKFSLVEIVVSVNRAAERFFQGLLLKKIFRWTTSPPPHPSQQLFRSKNFPHEYVAIAFQGLYLNFPCQISVFSPKNPDILSFARKYLTHKKDWGPTKHFQGPGAICPPCPPSRRPCLSIKCDM
jgi:hypothetical protein